MIVAATLSLPASAGEAAHEDRAPLVVVTGLGNIEPDELRLACRSLLSALPVRCEVRGDEPVEAYREGWNRAREQMDARGILESIFRRRSVDSHVELLITDFDLYEGERPFVFGLGSLTDRVAVVSTARIAADSAAFEARLAKLVRHEVGHTLGLPHHDARDCVMRSDATVAALDTAPEALCEICRIRFSTNARRLARPGQIELDHARGLLVRGELEAARGEARDVVERSRDGELIHELASTFLLAGAADDAVQLFRVALRRDPGNAELHANLAIALQRRGRHGDLDFAILHLERAMALRPQWLGMDAHLRRLRAIASTPASAQGPDGH